MSYDQIIVCLEQKQIILTKILNLTKQIEVRCKQPEIRMDDLLDKRNVFLDRMNKCSSLISNLIRQLPDKDQGRMHTLLEGKEHLLNITEQEQKIARLAAECRILVQKSSLLDNDARELLQNKLSEIKKKIKESHYQDGNMFHIK